MERILLTENKTSLCVTLYRYSFSNAIAHLQILSHNVTNQLQLHIKLSILQDSLLDLLGSDYWYISFESRNNYIFDSLPLSFVSMFVITLSYKLIRIPNRFAYEDTHKLDRYPVLLCDIFMISIRFRGSFNDLFDLLNTQIFTMPFLKFASPDSIMILHLL